MSNSVSRGESGDTPSPAAPDKPISARVLANFGEAVAASVIRSKPDENTDAQISAGEFPIHSHGDSALELEQASTFKAVPLKKLPLLVAGDIVHCEPVRNEQQQPSAESINNDAGKPKGSGAIGDYRVTQLIQRSSALARPDRRGQLKPVAANLSQLIIVCTPQPAPDRLLIDQFCVVAANQNIEPLIVLNKSDLLLDTSAADDSPGADNSSGLSKADGDKLLKPYADAGFETLIMSSKTGDGMAQLRSALSRHTSVLVGQSGVGKSSIIKHILPDQDIRVGAISAATGLGAHTTTVSFFYALEGGGALIDSPGVRQFAVSYLEPSQIMHGFPEIARLASNCRFHNCIHRHEPDCAVLAALQDGQLDKTRYGNFCRLLDS